MDKSGENYADLANINLLLILDGFANMIESSHSGSPYFCESSFWASQHKQAAKA
jgi:hypothetical protein